MRNLIFVPLFFMLACVGNSTDRSSQTSSADSTPVDTLSYVYRSFTKSSQYLVEKDSVVDSTNFKITYPEFSDSSINNLIKSAILIEGENNFQDAAQTFIDGYDEFIEEETTQQVRMPWFKHIQTSVSLNTPKLFALTTMYQQYTGGAHGNTVVIWSNFDVSQKQKIKLSNIISADKLPELTKKAEQRFRKMENLSDNAPLDKDFFFENGIFALNDNFGLTKDELLFYYNEYEIKPYSEGPSIIRLPYTELTDILSTQGKEYVDDIKKGY